MKPESQISTGFFFLEGHSSNISNMASMKDLFAGLKIATVYQKIGRRVFRVFEIKPNKRIPRLCGLFGSSVIGALYSEVEGTKFVFCLFFLIC